MTLEIIMTEGAVNLFSDYLKRQWSDDRTSLREHFDSWFADISGGVNELVNRETLWKACRQHVIQSGNEYVN